MLKALKDKKFGYSKLLRGLMAVSMGVNGTMFLLSLFTAPFTTELINFENGDFFFEGLSRGLDSGVYFFISLVLWKVINTSILKHPFEEINIKRLRRLGFTLIPLDLFIFAMVAVGVFSNQNQIMAVIAKALFGMTMKPYINLTVGIVILSISEIINVGINLKQESELTV